MSDRTQRDMRGAGIQVKVRIGVPKPNRRRASLLVRASGPVLMLGEESLFFANPFGGEKEAAVLTEVGKHLLGNFLVVEPWARDLQYGHVR